MSGKTSETFPGWFTVDLGLASKHLSRRNSKNLAHLAQPARSNRVFCLLILLNLLERNANRAA
jgi:hypothetical protein